MGRATAIALATDGWDVTLIARRQAALAKTVEMAPAEVRSRMHLAPGDIVDRPAIDAIAKSVLSMHGRIDALVNAAGTNIPERSLEKWTEARFREVFDVNLAGALNTIMAFLPAMRSQQGGTIVNINSIAGQNASVLSGAAYVMSKFALAGLTQSINAEEAKNNIRATSIFPGDINTEILEKRPTPPPPEARAKMLQPQDIAECVMLAINLPPRAVVEELRIVPR
ncbi:MAG: Sepiapterin reductase [Phycisphaerales bacterium]|nr:Sepiapterin reductase [Phycisphaerales bacterium]